MMRTFLLISGWIVLFTTGCSSHLETQGEMQSSTTGTIFVRTGYVTDVRDVTIQDHSRGSAAPAVGALVGGVAGSLIGSGTGRVISTLGGAAGGSLAAQQLTQAEKSSFKKVSVRFEDGTSQVYDVSTEDSFRVGEPVKVVNRHGVIQLMR